jgi:hypothetical protein
MKFRFDPKFSFHQLFSNSDGKTSASGFAGILVILAGLVAFLFGVEEFFRASKNDIMNQSIIVITIGAGLLGVRKSKDSTLANSLSDSDPDPAPQATIQQTTTVTPATTVSSTTVTVPVEEEKPADPSLKS